MNIKPSEKETSLIGNWIEKDGAVTQDAICERIHWLTNSYFDEIYIDGDNWTALYRDPNDQSFWELTFPKSQMHGGGPPALQRVSNNYAKGRYNIDEIAQKK